MGDMPPVNPSRILSSRLTLAEIDKPFGPYEDVGSEIHVHPDNILTSLMVHLEAVRDGPGRDHYLAWLSGPTGRRLVGQGGLSGGFPGPSSYGFSVLCDFSQEGAYSVTVVQAGSEATVARFALHVVHDRSAPLNPPYYGPDA